MNLRKCILQIKIKLIKNYYECAKHMTTIAQLEKQKQDLINSLNQILNDPNIPINDKMPVVKELSRAIANIAEQINRQTPEKKPELTKKEEIKMVRKEKKELQPTQIPKKAEEAKWRMADIIKVRS
jgi:hypothetical protein